MSDPFADNPNVGASIDQLVTGKLDLPARLRAAISIKSLDPANGTTLTALPPATLEHILLALDAAVESLPWIGVPEIQDRLGRALA